MCIASGKSRSVKGASRQPAFMDSCLTCLFSVYLIDKLIHICSVPLTFLIAGLAVAPLTLFKDKITLHCSAEIKCQQGFTTEIGY